MKTTKTYFKLFFIILSTMFLSCELFEDDEISSDSSATKCIVGHWKRNICDGTQIAEIIFNANGRGYFKDKDCNDICVRVFEFEWFDNESTVTLSYDFALICGEEAPIPNGGSQSYTCSGNSLFLGQNYSRAF